MPPLNNDPEMMRKPAKVTIDQETYSAILRACRIWADDGQVAAYVAAPHQGITPEMVGYARRKLIARGRLTARDYSMSRYCADR